MMGQNPNLRKVTALILLCALLMMAIALPIPGKNARADNIFRLHILADSDDPVDQAVKLRVRDAVLSFLPACDSAAQTEAYLLCHGEELLALVEKTLEECGAEQTAQLMLGAYPFPEKTYGDRIYPAGEYRALRILLGSGQGQNWWCVLFPPLCIVTKEQEPLPELDEIEFESSLVNWVRSWGDGA